MKTGIYKSTVKTPFGEFVVAVESTEVDARSDIYNAAYSEFKAPNGMLRFGEVQKSNQRLVKSMSPIRGAENWAWVKRG